MKTMIKIYQVDSFTNKPFAGNPAGVCLLEQAAPEKWMQQVANEMNLAETAFLWRENHGYRLRWFTPETEVKLCGHATLASAHILWEHRIEPIDKEIVFYTLSGNLLATKDEEWISLDFPKIDTDEAAIPQVLKDAIDAEISALFESTSGYSVVLLHDEEKVRTLKVNFELLKQYKGDVVIATAPSSGDPYDFISRVFVPKFGINEDPVTGSAHCCLAVYWGKKTNKNSFTAYQASSRGGVVKLFLNDDRVKLIGQAVTVFDANMKHITIQ